MFGLGSRRGGAAAIPAVASALSPSRYARPHKVEAAVQIRPARSQRLLVISNTYGGGARLTPLLERKGFVPILVPVDEVSQADKRVQRPDAVLVLRDAPAAKKEGVCRMIRESSWFGDIPIAVLTTLLEGGLNLSADVVARSPSSLQDALDRLGGLLEVRRPTSVMSY
jgi:hypothetical protein